MAQCQNCPWCSISGNVRGGEENEQHRARGTLGVQGYGVYEGMKRVW
jgi:hypothetical protein